MAVKIGICLTLAALALPVSVDDGLFARGQAEEGRQRWAGWDRVRRRNWNKSGDWDWNWSKRRREGGPDIGDGLIDDGVAGWMGGSGERG